MNKPAVPTFKVSVIVLNYNGMEWLNRCFDSLEEQTLFNQIEVIMTDNHSSDGSVEFAEAWSRRTGRGQVVNNGANLGYCQANNNGAAVATGEYLLFLNNDTWLEPDCLERLYFEAKNTGADVAGPLILNYEDDSFQGIGSPGLDLFGIPTYLTPIENGSRIFAASGCSLFIRAETFRQIGGFDGELFIYADETDVCWKVWIAGGKAVAAISARVHHRGAAVVNPKGQTKHVELRTTDFKRHLANRNGTLILLKNSQHILLILLVPHLFLLATEAVVSLLVVRRWSHIRRCYIGAILDCWRLRAHVLSWRRRIRAFRRRSDFFMLRFLRLKPARWLDFKAVIRLGLPKVDAK
jgi:GT2 family glycosyltransferase